MDEITALDIISIKREAAKLIRVNTDSSSENVP